jgi:hypothetical protein
MCVGRNRTISRGDVLDLSAGAKLLPERTFESCDLGRLGGGRLDDDDKQDNDLGAGEEVGQSFDVAAESNPAPWPCHDGVDPCCAV